MIVYVITLHPDGRLKADPRTCEYARLQGDCIRIGSGIRGGDYWSGSYPRDIVHMTLEAAEAAIALRVLGGRSNTR